jgi:probable rRNA maturation factor
MSLEVTVQFATRKPWVPARNLLALWAYGTLRRRGDRCDLAVRIVGNAESRRLNKRYRRKDRPTNVLAFPAGLIVDGRRQLGDLVICAPVVAREAREQGKSRQAHWAHMIVHATLHLLGYDHQHPREAKRMQRREVAILKSLGYANPYLQTI